MTRKPKPDLKIEYDSDGNPVYGVGPAVGRKFVEAYFPEAQSLIRIASAYFTLTGYKFGRRYISPHVQYRVLVGHEEGWNVKKTVADEILSSLGECEDDLWDAVFELVERMKNGHFIIRDAREMVAAFHCKFFICDDKVAWQGSANYTGRGLHESAEQLDASRDPKCIQMLSEWYDRVAAEATDLLEELITRLEAWLNLASPFDVYLKTLQLLNNLPDYSMRPGAYFPTYYQKGIISRALRQIDEYNGALLVVATGLGKTVIGAEIAKRLLLDRKSKRVIFIAPNVVHENWKSQFEGRDVYPVYFSTDLLFRQASDKSYHQTTELVRQLSNSDHETFIIIDEAHFYRNQLLTQEAKRQPSLVFERLIPVLDTGAKILLLTATAYSTSLQNLNSLLYLLPHRRPSLIEGLSPWETHSVDDFAHLPVVTTLGLPHVLKMARSRGDIDTQGRTFVNYADQPHYLPKKIKLHTVRYQLFLSETLSTFFDKNYFDSSVRIAHLMYDDDTLSTRRVGVDTIYNYSVASWLGSPSVMVESIERNLATLGENDINIASDAQTRMTFGTQNAGASHAYVTQLEAHQSQTVQGSTYGKPMLLSLELRQRVLRPLLEQLSRIGNDDKLLKLASIIDQHCVQEKGKAVVFVERHLTAQYVERGLGDLLGNSIKVGSTVEGDDSPRLVSGRARSEILKRFSPRSHKYKTNHEYDVLICTDADGIGVNLQDADTIINYDPPDAADVLFQRVGRVLRMTPNPERSVQFYTLVPSIIDEPETESDVRKNIREVFARITQRHNSSKRILGSDAISSEEHIEISLDDELDVEQLTRDYNLLEDIVGVSTDSVLSHAAVLEQYRTRAEALQTSDCLLSAKASKQTKHRMFVLLKYEESYLPIMYNISSQRLEELDDLTKLDLIACTENEPRAMVNQANIEHFANQAAQAWCGSKHISVDQVRKVCALYLVPSTEKSNVAQMLTRQKSE